MTDDDLFAKLLLVDTESVAFKLRRLWEAVKYLCAYPFIAPVSDWHRIIESASRVSLMVTISKQAVAMQADDSEKKRLCDKLIAMANRGMVS